MTAILSTLNPIDAVCGAVAVLLILVLSSERYAGRIWDWIERGGL